MPESSGFAGTVPRDVEELFSRHALSLSGFPEKRGQKGS